jgi:hypothetical protein
MSRDAEASAAGDTLAAIYRGAARAMRDLPVYNPALAVAAIGFRALDDHAFGVIVTPWFMNLVRVPLDCTDAVDGVTGRPGRAGRLANWRKGGRPSN